MGKYLDATGLSHFISKIKMTFQEKLVSGTNIKTINNTSLLGNGNIGIPYAESFSAGGNANYTNAILYGTVDSTSTATVFTATVEGLDALVDGTCIMLHNGVITSAEGFTLNINGLGAKPCYNNMTNATRDTTIFNANYTMLFIYSTELDSGSGGWWIYRGYDANTNTIGYQLRTNSSSLVSIEKGYKYRIWLTVADGTKMMPINTSTSTNATTARSLNTRKFNPFGRIVYRSTNGTCNAGDALGATAIWDQYTLTIGYSYMQSGFSLTSPAPVYIKATPQSDGSAVMDTIVQTLPSTNDGKIYVFLGFAYSATAMELYLAHPVYYHDGTSIRIWTGKTIPTKVSELTNDSGYITNAGVTSFNGSTGAITYTAPVTSVNGSTGAVTVSVPSASTTNPSMDGTASYGSGTDYARANHVHPTDTSRAAVADLNGKVDASATDNSQTTTVDNFGSSVRMTSTNGNKYADIQVGRSGNASVSLYASQGTNDSELVVTPTGVTIYKLATPTTDTMPTSKEYVDTAVGTKQNTLVSGTNIKTINNESILGSGNIAISTDSTSTDISLDDIPMSEEAASYFENWEGAGEEGADNVSLALNALYDGISSLSGGSTVTVTQSLSSGTQVGSISIDGTPTTLYAPTPPTASTTTPSMDGTASYGSGTSYARANHIHPTDTSRAASDHTHGNITNGGDITATAPTIASGDKLIINDESASKITNGPSFGTSTTTYLRNDGTWGTPAGTANQNAFSNVKVGSTTVAAEITTDTLELVGSNVTLTPDATNDKVTIGITASNVTTALGNTAVARASANASGTTFGDAAVKNVDTSISSSSTSTNLPTTAAVVNYIAGMTTSVSMEDTDVDDAVNAAWSGVSISVANGVSF